MCLFSHAELVHHFNGFLIQIYCYFYLCYKSVCVRSEERIQSPATEATGVSMSSHAGSGNGRTEQQEGEDAPPALILLSFLNNVLQFD